MIIKKDKIELTLEEKHTLIRELKFAVLCQLQSEHLLTHEQTNQVLKSLS